MPTHHLSYRDTHYFSDLICDYLAEKDDLKPLYHRFPKRVNFKSQIEEKRASFSSTTRATLVQALKQQYDGINTSESTLTNIDLLNKSNTFTITTGHQLNLFTGPLYFLYKIISVINLTEELKELHPEHNFVPVYWMATEDHDFEEINYFNFKGQKVIWPRAASGAVGRLSMAGLDVVFKSFSKHLGSSEDAKTIKDLFENAYLKSDNLAEATRYLANQLFGHYGLVILDGDDKQLKALFAPFAKKELIDQTSFKQVSKTNELLAKLNYKIQVNPRSINLFYLTDELRERLIEHEGKYIVNNTDLSFSKDNILQEVEEHPERFSPNALLRPLYQEIVLPNLCYIGGGGELAYWMQLRSYFDAVEVTFPMLLLRNSVLITTEKQHEKLKKLGLTINDLFLKQDALVEKHVKQVSKIKIDFSIQKDQLKKQFEALYELANQTDKSFLGAVAAQERKQIKGLEHLEKRLLKAQKRKLNDELERVKSLQNDLFPNQSLQERSKNFSEFYLDYGQNLISILKSELQPLNGEFTTIEF